MSPVRIDIEVLRYFKAYVMFIYHHLLWLFLLFFCFFMFIFKFIFWFVVYLLWWLKYLSLVFDNVGVDFRVSEFLESHEAEVPHTSAVLDQQASLLLDCLNVRFKPCVLLK